MKNILLGCAFIWLSSGVSLFAQDSAPQDMGNNLLFLQPQTFPPYAGVMPFFHEDTRTLPRGRMSLHSAVLYFNTFRQDNGKQDPAVQFFLDMEGAAAILEGRYSPAEDWEVSTQIQVIGAYPGFLDPLLTGFHRFFGFPNQSREFFPENDLKWSLEYQGKTITSGQSPVLGLTQVSLSSKYVLPLRWNSEGRLGIKTWIKPPIPSEGNFLNTEIWSTGAGILYSDFWNPPGWSRDEGLRWGLSGGFGVVQPSDWDLPGRLFIYHGGFHGGLMWNRLFIGAQGALFQSPFDINSNYLGVRAGEVHLGVKGPLGPGMWEVALVEELLTWGTMEVGLHAGGSWTF